jgi:hypothetical protein
VFPFLPIYLSTVADASPSGIAVWQCCAHFSMSLSISSFGTQNAPLEIQSFAPSRKCGRVVSCQSQIGKEHAETKRRNGELETAKGGKLVGEVSKGH